MIFFQVSFDAETISHCKFQVRASSIDGQQSTAMVVVQILDQNDNAPTFAHDKFVGHVVEGIPAGSTVLDAKGKPLVINASDIDVSESGKLTYEIVELSAKVAFAVHPATGAITTNKVWCFPSLFFLPVYRLTVLTIVLTSLISGVSSLGSHLWGLRFDISCSFHKPPPTHLELSFIFSSFFPPGTRL